MQGARSRSRGQQVCAGCVAEIGPADTGSWLDASARGSAATIKSSLTAMGWVIVVATIFNASVSSMEPA
jgi:hypothetical protein